jgi:glutathione S-transferase
VNLGTKTAITLADLSLLPRPENGTNEARESLSWWATLAELQVYPAHRFVRVRTVEGSRDLAEDQLLETPVLPGFQAKVQAFFAR